MKGELWYKDDIVGKLYQSIKLHKTDKDKHTHTYVTMFNTNGGGEQESIANIGMKRYTCTHYNKRIHNITPTLTVAFDCIVNKKKVEKIKICTHILQFQEK